MTANKTRGVFLWIIIFHLFIQETNVCNILKSRHNTAMVYFSLLYLVIKICEHISAACDSYSWYTVCVNSKVCDWCLKIPKAWVKNFLTDHVHSQAPQKLTQQENASSQIKQRKRVLHHHKTNISIVTPCGINLILRGFFKISALNGTKRIKQNTLILTCLDKFLLKLTQFS